MSAIHEELNKLIEESVKIKQVAYRPSKNHFPAYYEGVEYEVWISKCMDFLENYFKGNILVTKFKEASERAVGNGEKYYNTMVGVLHALAENSEGIKSEVRKERKIFISHCSKDSPITDKVVELIKDMGITDEQIYYSSHDETGAKLLQDCFESIKVQFNNYELMIIFIISENFYRSMPCIAETGATWVTSENRYIPIILPPYDYSDIKGVIKTTQNGIVLKDKEISTKLESLKTQIEEFMNIENKVNPTGWCRKKEIFISDIDKEFSKIKTVEYSIQDISVNNDGQMVIKVNIKNNIKKRLRIESVKINLKCKENDDIEIYQDDWNVQALVMQSLESITFYINSKIEKSIKKSQIKLNESNIQIECNEEQ